MGIPFLSTLSKSARTLYPQILAGTRRGLSSRAIERSIRAAGFSISRGRTIVPLMRAIQAVERQGAAVRNVGLKRAINTARLPVSLTPLRRNYSYVFRVFGTNGNGERVEAFLTYATNDNKLTREYMQDRITELAHKANSWEVLEDVEVTLVHGMRSSELI